MFTGVGSLLGNLGPYAVAAAICWWITRKVVRGDLVPRKNLEDVQTDRDHWRTAADGWQAMATKLGMAVEVNTASVERLNASAEASTHALKEIQAVLPRSPS